SCLHPPSSTARSTRSLHDALPIFDVFVAFPPDLPRADLEERGLALGKLLDKGAHLYAEHPYTRGWYGGFEVEIVPCYRITDASQDRKSTRLNSSHQIISYAVFCLE